MKMLIALFLISGSVFAQGSLDPWLAAAGVSAEVRLQQCMDECVAAFERPGPGLRQCVSECQARYRNGEFGKVRQ